jgi:hypothetical protein
MSELKTISPARAAELMRKGAVLRPTNMRANAFPAPAITR